MTDYYSLPELPYGLPELPYGMTDDRPSGLRVLAKSLHLLALGWLATVAWLWIAQIQLNIERFSMPPEGYAVRTLVEGVIPALLVEMMAFWMASAHRPRARGRATTHAGNGCTRCGGRSFPTCSWSERPTG